MRILLTGATGFLGQHIVKRLARENVDIRTVVRPNSETEHLNYKKMEFIVGDLRDENTIKKAIRDVDVVIHAAASRGGSWNTIYADNVQSTELLLKHSLKKKVKRFIFISTVMVYDHTNAKNGTIFREEYPYEEKNLNFYSKSKIEAERIVKHYFVHYGLPCVVLRPVGLYGIGGYLYPPRLGLAMGENGYILIDHFRTPYPLTHVDSVAQAIWLCIKNKSSAGKFYNVVEDGPISRRDYLKSTKKNYNPKLKIFRIPYLLLKFVDFSLTKTFNLFGMRSPIRPLKFKLAAHGYYYPADRIKKDLGWQPITDIKMSIEQMMQWHRTKRTPKRLFPKNVNSMNKKAGQVLKIGIIGCGMFAETHLEIIKKLKYAQVAALCDVNEENLQKLANKFNIEKTYTDFIKMLRNEELDIVHVLTSAQTHAQLAIQAMKAGCHVFVEKPMSATSEEARKMIKAAKDNNVKLCVSHNLLYDKVMIKARKIIASGVLGKITQVETYLGASLSSSRGSHYLAYEGRNHWVYKLPGSLYQNFISHPLSVMMDTMEGPYTKIKAISKYFKVVPHMKSDELRVIIENKDTVGILNVSFAVSPRYMFMHALGTRASLEIDFLNNFTFLDKGIPFIPKVINRNLTIIRKANIMFWASVRNTLKTLFGQYSLFEGNKKLMTLFYHSILFDEAVPVTGEEGLHSMEIMEKIWPQIKVR